MGRCLHKGRGGHRKGRWLLVQAVVNLWGWLAGARRWEGVGSGRSRAALELDAALVVGATVVAH